MDDLRGKDPDPMLPSRAASASLSSTGRPSSRDARVHAGIDALEGMDLAQLRNLWQKLYRQPAPRFFRREFLIRGLAYQSQVKAYGGLSPKTRRKLLKIAAQAEEGTFTTAGAPRRLRPGTRLVRAYQGKTHTVDVLTDGFAWNGKKYRSLSAIAKAITGTSWSGAVFFGLIRPTKAPPAPKSEAVDG